MRSDSTLRLPDGRPARHIPGSRQISSSVRRATLPSHDRHRARSPDIRVIVNAFLSAIQVTLTRMIRRYTSPKGVVISDHPYNDGSRVNTLPHLGKMTVQNIHAEDDAIITPFSRSEDTPNGTSRVSSGRRDYRAPDECR